MGDYAEPDVSRAEKAFRRLERGADNALRTQDPVAYFRFINDSGIPPTDEPLYELGCALVEGSRSQPDGDLERTVEVTDSKPTRQRQLRRPRNPEKIKAFLRESTGISIDDLGASSDSKAKLLLQYFPGMFGRGKRQDLRHYTNAQLGTIFKDMFNGYRQKQEKGLLD